MCVGWGGEEEEEESGMCVWMDQNDVCISVCLSVCMNMMLLAVMFVEYCTYSLMHTICTIHPEQNYRHYTLHLLASIRTVVKYNITVLLYRVVCTLSSSAIDPSALYVPYHTNLY